MPPRLNLTVEVLEDRWTPTTAGQLWPDPSHLTVSFVPDGTPIGPVQTNTFADPISQPTSDLFALLGAQLPTANWQQELLRSLQTWAAQTNSNLAVVADSGAPLGQTGLLPGTSGFGDIRIAAAPLSGGSVAIAVPFNPQAGNYSGDIILNSNYLFGSTNPSAYDLFSVAVHEAGHLFGLPDSDDPSSVMYDNYTGTRQGLAPEDVAAVQAEYGVRQADLTGNNTPATATPFLQADTAPNLPPPGGGASGGSSAGSFATAISLTPITTPQPGEAGYRATGTLYSPDSVGDFYRLSLPTGALTSTATLTVTVRQPTSGAVVGLYDANEQPLRLQTLASGVGELSVQADQLQAGATYYVEVSNPTASTANPYQLVAQVSNTAQDTQAATPFSLDSTQPLGGWYLEIQENDVVGVQLLSTADPGGHTTLEAGLYDANGKLIYDTVGPAGQIQAGSRLLVPGYYFLAVYGHTTEGSTLPNLEVNPRVEVLSDPIGPILGANPGGNPIWLGPEPIPMQEVWGPILLPPPGLPNQIPPPPPPPGAPAGPVSTTTVVTTNLNPAPPGQAVAFTATVSAANGGVPTGTVTFMDGNTVLGTVALQAGMSGAQAALTTANLAMGNHTITATYSGDNNNAISSGSVSETVQLLSTWLLFGANYTQVVEGQPVTFMAYVTSQVTPTGTITIIDGANILATLTLVPSTINGTAWTGLTTSDLGVGTHTIVAVYSGDSEHPPLTSDPPVTEVVTSG
jgi:X-X-X-Leu-X-X-Gly heptad repeat protein